MKVRVKIQMTSEVEISMTDKRFRSLHDLSPNQAEAQKALLAELGERTIVDGINFVYLDEVVELRKLPPSPRRPRKA